MSVNWPSVRRPCRALLGFLWYNCYPAEVFMGDTGSLPTGTPGFGAPAIRQEALLVLVGGIFVIETLSVLLQVGWFKMTKRRILLCSPLHNHFPSEATTNEDRRPLLDQRRWRRSRWRALKSVKSARSCRLVEN